MTIRLDLIVHEKNTICELFVILFNDDLGHLHCPYTYFRTKKNRIEYLFVNDVINIWQRKTS